MNNTRVPRSSPPRNSGANALPLSDRPGLFPEDIDSSDPWQFRNVLVR